MAIAFRFAMTARRKIHFVPPAAPWRAPDGPVTSTACSRFVEQSEPHLSVTTRRAHVTCKACRHAMAGDLQDDDGLRRT